MKEHSKFYNQVAVFEVVYREFDFSFKTWDLNL